jgi:hypothetical protein
MARIAKFDDRPDYQPVAGRQQAADELDRASPGRKEMEKE